VVTAAADICPNTGGYRIIAARRYGGTMVFARQRIKPSEKAASFCRRHHLWC
jgi:hypothetical protein